MRRLLLTALVLVATGCRFDKEPIGPRAWQPVVHGVLDPGVTRQQILLERTLTGITRVPEHAVFDSLDPIATHGGSPIQDAIVIVYGPNGDSAVAVERRLDPSGVRGTGVYEFMNQPVDPTSPQADQSLPIVRGGTYRLSVTFPLSPGQVTATTTVPDAPSAVGSSFESFNRDHESVFLFWDEMPGTTRYAIGITTPRGPFRMFVDSLEFLVSGSLRNTSIPSLEDVFHPGFTQSVTVAAVDRNYYDYYRSDNDQYSGRGLLSHVTGGLGVFGSSVLLRNRRLTVTADMDHRLEGTYGRVSGAGPQFITLYAMSVAGAQAKFSGNYSAPGLYPPGALGALNGDSLTLALLQGQTARDTAMLIQGKLTTNGTLTGTLRGGGPVEYRLLEFATRQER